jgi:hypothetical protein
VARGEGLARLVRLLPLVDRAEEGRPEAHRRRHRQHLPSSPTQSTRKANRMSTTRSCCSHHVAAIMLQPSDSPRPWSLQHSLVTAARPGHDGTAWSWRHGLVTAARPGHGGTAWSRRTRPRSKLNFCAHNSTPPHHEANAAKWHALGGSVLTASASPLLHKTAIVTSPLIRISFACRAPP